MSDQNPPIVPVPLPRAGERRRLLPGLALVVATASAFAGTALPASADSTSPVTVTAVVGTGGLDGTRSITASPAVALLPVGTSLTGTLAVTVTEAAKLGTNPWSVTAVVGNFANGSSSIPAGDLAMGTPTAPTAAVGCLSLTVVTGNRCGAAPGAGGALDGPKTLFTITGESTTVAYTGAYAGSAPLTLTVPNGTAAGSYTGTITVTLIG